MRKLNETKNIIDILTAVKAGKISMIKDQFGNIQGIGVNHPDLKVGEVNYVKRVGPGQAVGRTLEEMEADEQALREWMDKYSMCDVLNAVRLGEVLNKSTWDENDASYIESELQRLIEDAVNEDRRDRPTPSPRQATSSTTPTRGKYPNLYEQLNVLDVETLKEMKRTATRNGADDLKNACRTVLRHKGVAC